MNKNLDIEQYEKDLLAGAERIKDLMRQTWGVAPEIEFTVEPAMIVRANFSMKGFQHRGAKKYLDAKTIAGYRKPFLMAAEIMSEVMTHRNTCADCGEDVPTIYRRLQHAKCILDMRAYQWRFDEKDGTEEYEMIDREHPKRLVQTGRADRPDYEVDNYKKVRLPLILPDFVELMLAPRAAKVIGKAALVAKKKGWAVREAAGCPVKEGDVQKEEAAA